MLAENNDFKMVSMDIRAVFLKAKKFDREVFVRPPDDKKGRKNMEIVKTIIWVR